jgi:hypothetical protein
MVCSVEVFSQTATLNFFHQRAKRTMLVIFIPLTAALMATILSVFYANTVRNSNERPVVSIN